MKNSRKLNHCLNCGNELGQEVNFCPTCGQENKDEKVSIFRFVEDFISNYLNFETVFFQTLPAFFIHPGKLTNTFNEGKRKKYIHPIRLYLITSLFYFFIIALVIPVDLVDKIMTGELTPEQIENSSDGIVKLNTQAAATFDSLKNSGQLDGVEELGINLDSMVMNTQSLSDLDDFVQDTVEQSRNDWKKLRTLSINPEISDSAFNMALSKTSFNASFGLESHQKRKFVANSGLFITSAAQNLPFMMFLLLPFFAFFLWLVNIRSKKYYVEHLIHGLHLHAFAYVIYGLAILWIAKTHIGVSTVTIGAFIGVSTYAYISMLNVLKQGWFKTLIKFWIIGFFYITAIALALSIELYISLITF
ncbi:DUF3667 domain-containing protein [Algoriphagus aestuarii]|nr:DUF3667 domain-containing protein [Algoriphagus aestuarii]